MEWAAWVVWEEWAAWECNPHYSQTKIQKGQFLLPFFFSKKFVYRTIIMSKRYSGKSFKDSSIKKKPKLSFKEKRKLKREKRKNTS